MSSANKGGRISIGQWLFALYAACVFVFTIVQFAKMKASSPARFFEEKFSVEPAKSILGPMTSVRSPKSLGRSNARVRLSGNELVATRDVKQLWRYRFSPQDAMERASVYVLGKIVIVGGPRGALIALSRETGEYLWSYDLTLSRGRMTFAKYVDEGDILLAAEDRRVSRGFLLKIEALTGKKKWISSAVNLSQVEGARKLGSCGERTYIQVSPTTVALFSGDNERADLSSDSPIKDIECVGDKVVISKVESDGR